VYIKETKDAIAKHPKTLEKEAARMEEKMAKVNVKQETSSEDDEEMDIDIKLD
jgi:hypothetical protein